MTHCMTVVFFMLITYTLSLNSELRAEKLIGGSPAIASDYKYHVGIISKYNGSNTRYLTCSGGILSDILVISSTECFFDRHNQLLKLRFFVVVGSVNLRHDVKDAKEIAAIYTYTHKPMSYKHRILILQLENSLHLYNNYYLQKLTLTDKNTIDNSNLRVAGYGFTSFVEKKLSTGKSRAKITSKRNFLLMWAHVDSLEYVDCQVPHLNPKKEMCGIIKKRHAIEHRGLCSYEEGAPLVADENLLVAISNKNRRDCDNTKYGHMFTKVFYYLDFINGVLHENFTSETVVHINREHFE